MTNKPNKVDLMRAKSDKKFMERMKSQAEKIAKKHGIKSSEIRKHPEVIKELLEVVQLSLKQELNLDPNIEYDPDEATRIINGEKKIEPKKK